MEDLRAEQIEALQTLVGYTPKLLGGIETSAGELLGERKEDTDGFLRLVIDGINWVLNIVNACLDMINEGEVRLDKEAANDASVRFSKAFATGDDATIGNSLLADVKPLIEEITAACEKVL